MTTDGLTVDGNDATQRAVFNRFALLGIHPRILQYELARPHARSFMLQAVFLAGRPVPPSSACAEPTVCRLSATCCTPRQPRSRRRSAQEPVSVSAASPASLCSSTVIDRVGSDRVLSLLSVFRSDGDNKEAAVIAENNPRATLNLFGSASDFSRNLIVRLARSVVDPPQGAGLGLERKS